MVVYTDGSSRPRQSRKTGPAGIGIVLRTKHLPDQVISKYIGYKTSCWAEAQALFEGLCLAQKMTKGKIEIRIDQESLIDVLCNPEYKNRNERYTKLIKRIQEKIDTNVSIRWVPREKNPADRHARRASKRDNIFKN